MTPSILGPHLDSSCCCPVSWRSCGFTSAGLALSYVPAVYRCYRFWSGSTWSPGSGPGWRMSWPACRIAPICYQGELSRTAPAKPPKAATGKRLGRFSCSRALRSAHLHTCLQSQLHCAAQSRFKAHSPKSEACKELGSSLLPRPPGRLTCVFLIRANSIVQPGQGSGPARLWPPVRESAL